MSARTSLGLMSLSGSREGPASPSHRGSGWGQIYTNASDDVRGCAGSTAGGRCLAGESAGVVGWLRLLRRAPGLLLGLRGVHVDVLLLGQPLDLVHDLVGDG